MNEIKKLFDMLKKQPYCYMGIDGEPKVRVKIIQEIIDYENNIFRIRFEYKSLDGKIISYPLVIDKNRCNEEKTFYICVKNHIKLGVGKIFQKVKTGKYTKLP